MIELALVVAGMGVLVLAVGLVWVLAEALLLWLRYRWLGRGLGRRRWR